VTAPLASKQGRLLKLADDLNARLVKDGKKAISIVELAEIWTALREYAAVLVEARPPSEATGGEPWKNPYDTAEPSNDAGTRLAFETIENYFKPGSALPGAVAYLKKQVRSLELMVIEESARAMRPNEPAPAEATAVQHKAPWQDRVHSWMRVCFGELIAANRIERNHRFLEESLELVQACGCTQSEAHQLVDYVFGRPVGEIQQEIGGAMVTLAALCNANLIDMETAGDTELARCWENIDRIREKQAQKPKHSPLPGAPNEPGADQKDCAECDGFGEFYGQHSITGGPTSPYDCAKCNGTGKQPQTKGDIHG